MYIRILYTDLYYLISHKFHGDQFTTICLVLVGHPHLGHASPDGPCCILPQELRSVTGHPMILADDLIEASSSVGAPCHGKNTSL